MKERKRWKIGSFLSFWAISLVFAGGLVIFLLKFMGLPVGATVLNLGQSIPGLNQLLPPAENVQAEEQNGEEYWKQQFEQSQEMLKSVDEDLTEALAELERSESERVKLQKDFENYVSQEKAGESEAVQEKVDAVAEIYASMSASKAAGIIEVMELEEAAGTLMPLEQKQQAKILGSFKNKEKAAEITMLMKEIAVLPYSGQADQGEKLKELADSKQDPVSAVSETLANMPPAQSALIIVSMMGTDSESALGMMRDMEAGVRSQILAEVAGIDADIAAEITRNLNQ